MSGGKYLAARDAFGTGSLSWTTHRIVAQLVSADYEFDEKHTQPSDIAVGAVGLPIPVPGTEFKDGWARADKLLFLQVKGRTVVAVVFYEQAALQRLIAYQNEIDNFPMVVNGGDIEIEILQPGIFRL